MDMATSTAPTRCAKHRTREDAQSRSIVLERPRARSSRNLEEGYKMPTERPGVKWMRAGLGAATLLALISFVSVARAQEPKGPSGNDVAETGKKLSNPLSDVWALFTRFDARFADGDANQGNAKVGSSMLFQPILPVPLHGTGANLCFNDAATT